MGRNERNVLATERDISLSINNGESAGLSAAVPLRGTILGVLTKWFDNAPTADSVPQGT